MTTNQTIDGVLVSRELAERLAVPMLRTPEYLLDHRDALDELRALLDANPEKNGPCPECGGSLVTWGCTCTPRWPMYKPAAQAQGEPVAWQYRVSAGPQTGWSLWHDGKGEELRKFYQVETRPLYAANPAPVAVLNAKSR